MGRKIRYGLVVLLAAGLAAVFAGAERSEDSDFRLGRNMEILMNLFRDVNLFYVDSVSPDRLLEDAAAGMTGKLDPYTEYIPEEEMDDFEIMTTGKYGGIGSLIRKKGDWVVIAQPYKGFPADRAGLKIGDKIVEIEGQDARGFDPARVSALLKGDPGTTVRLKVERFATGKVEPVSIRRERIVISGVPYHGFVADSIGYIQHSDFTEDCSTDLRRALAELRSSGRLKGLILDLRGNGGGILQEAVKILSLFVPKGTEVVSMRGKFEQLDATFKTEGEPVDTELPIVVLTDRGSASAAEIVSGALQDLDRAVLLGQRTFGKGLVQSTRPLGYNSYLKVTTAKYYIPTGRCIQAIDYAHRNEDGSVGYVPDSLIREFRTRAGRKVYDGGGIMPDVRTEPRYVSRFAMILYGKGYIEDFVDGYVKRHPEPVDVERFALSDADYADFTEFMKDKDVEFRSESKLALAQLREKAKQERYLDRIGPQLDEIEKGLRDDKESNLKLYCKELSQIIEDEIILRSHYAQGVTRHKLLSDEEVKQAVELLGDTARYRNILSSQDTARK